MMYLESLSLRTDYGIPPESLQIPNLKRLTIFQILFATTLRNLNSQLGREGILNSVALLSASDLIGCLDGIERGEANFEILRVLPHVGSPKLQKACDKLGVTMQEW